MIPQGKPQGIETEVSNDASTAVEERLKEIFDDASDLPAELRDSFLIERCGNDVKLRAGVEELLAAHDSAGSFLSPDAQPPLPDDASGQVIGRYTLLQKIGEGGFGTVYLAQQSHPVCRRVALKIIKPGMDSRQVIVRFQAERQALAMMGHPNIAKVFDAGATEAALPYFVMELVDGIPITRYCDEHQLNLRQRLELFIPICLGLQHAHQKGIIHRDIKPANLLVITCDGQAVPKLIDFGIAKALHQKLADLTQVTQLGATVGTLEYMSPEQTGSDEQGIDTRSDIYSLGVVLYELLAGTPPLEQKTLRSADYVEVLRMIRETDPPRPSIRIEDSGQTMTETSARRKTRAGILEAQVAGDLDWIVMKALEKDRARRYASAGDLVRDIQRYLCDEPVEAYPPSAGYRFRKFARKHRTALRLAAIGLLILLFATAFSTWEAMQANHATAATREQLRHTTEAESQAMHRLFDSRLAQAKAAHLSRRPGQRLDSLDVLADATRIARQLKLGEDSFEELRNAAIACLALPDLRRGKPWPGWPAGTDHIDFDGNLEHYARTDKQGAVSIRKVDGDVEIAQLPGQSSGETWPVFSRDGTFLAIGSQILNVWKLGGGEPELVLHRPAGDYFGMALSADSRRCAVSNRDGSLTIYDLYGEDAPRRIPAGGRTWKLAFHPQKPLIAVAREGGVDVRDLETGKIIASLATSQNVSELSWSPDGNTLGVACVIEQIYLWQPQSSAQPLILTGMANGGLRIAFNHAGNLLASTGWEGIVRLWDSHTGRQIFSTPGGIQGAAPTFSHDDRWMVGDRQDENIALWEVAVGEGEYRTLVRHQREGNNVYEYASIDKTGSILAVGTQDGFCLWDLADGTQAGFVRLPFCDNVLFDPTGPLLTNGSDCVLKWPVRKQGDGIKVGPPEKLAIRGTICNIATSGDGGVIAAAQGDGGSALNADSADHVLALRPHDDVRSVSVSCDGKWIATGSHNRTRVKVWDARTGRLQADLPDDGSRVTFSPDGKWLAATAGGLHLWSTQSWLIERRIGGGQCAFSPLGGMMAVETGYGEVRLVDPETGKEYARLEDPAQDRAREIRFNFSGTQLVTTNTDSNSIHIWDISRLRRQLAKMGLDWDAPPFPPEVPPQPLRIDIDAGELGGR